MQQVKKSWYRHLLEYLGITIGTLIMAFSINLFLEPHTIAPGGVTGLGIVIQKVSNGLIKVWVTNLVVNIPLFIGGVITLGKSFGAKTLYATIVLSLFIWLVPQAYATQDLLLSAIFGGVLLGMGVGIVFKAGGTTGGTDLAGAMLNKYFPVLSIASFMMVIDFFIVATSGAVNGKLEYPLYSLISLYISVKVIDLVLDGMGYAKAFIIVSDKSNEIALEVVESLNRGVTILKGRGFYTGNDKEVLLCAVNRSQITKFKEIIHNIDNNAFIMITEVNEVLGEGFKDLKK